VAVTPTAFTPAFPRASTFAERREKVFEKIGKNAIAIVQILSGQFHGHLVSPEADRETLIRRLTLDLKEKPNVVFFFCKGHISEVSWSWYKRKAVFAQT